MASHAAAVQFESRQLGNEVCTPVAAGPMTGTAHLGGDVIIRANLIDELRSNAVRKSRFIAIISGFTAFAAATGAHGQQAARRIALKSGESTELRNYYFVQHCQSIMIG